MYFFDSEAPKLAKTIKPSTRGELEIADLIDVYLKNNKLALQRLDSSIFWHDTGNAEALLSASVKVQKFEKDNNLKVGSYEIAAYEKGFISYSSLEKIANEFNKSDYGKAIKDYLDRQ